MLSGGGGGEEDSPNSSPARHLNVGTYSYFTPDYINNRMIVNDAHAIKSAIKGLYS